MQHGSPLWQTGPFFAGIIFLLWEIWRGWRVGVVRSGMHFAAILVSTSLGLLAAKLAGAPVRARQNIAVLPASIVVGGGEESSFPPGDSFGGPCPSDRATRFRPAPSRPSWGRNESPWRWGWTALSLASQCDPSPPRHRRGLARQQPAQNSSSLPAAGSWRALGSQVDAGTPLRPSIPPVRRHPASRKQRTRSSGRKAINRSEDVFSNFPKFRKSCNTPRFSDSSSLPSVHRPSGHKGKEQLPNS